MAEKKYREAKTDAEKKRGKSTDELTFEEALRFFKARGEEKGSSRFRWRGEAYDLKGNKLGSKPKAKSKSSSGSRPKEEPPVAKSAAVPKVTSSPLQTGRGDGIAEMARRTLDREDKNPKDTNRINYAEWKGMTRAERRAKGWPATTLALQNSGVSLYSKGGLARKTSSSGSTDYRKTGRFSKSASPRGFK